MESVGVEGGAEELSEFKRGLHLGVVSMSFGGFLPPHHTRVPRATSRLAWQPLAASRFLLTALEYSTNLWQAPGAALCCIFRFAAASQSD